MRPVQAAIFFFGVLVGSLFLPACAPAALPEQPGSVRLDAERVSYDDESGKTTAEGDAVLTYGKSMIRAERIEYDSVTQRVKASPLPGESVVLQSEGRTIAGDGLEYDLNTEEGVMSGAKSSVPVGEGTLYISGGNLDVIPWDLAAERGLVRKKGASPSLIARWQRVSATTCALDHPHYRVETRSITFIPGRLVVAKRPRLYLGKTYLFTWPMDYIINVDRRALQYSITPYVQKNSDKGTGVGLSGSYAWDGGMLNLGMSWWDRVDLEWMAEVEQSLGGGFGVRGGVKYSWDRAWDEKMHHPYGSLFYDRDGWRASLNWMRSEYIEDQKDSFYEYRGRLDRRPEFEVRSPWIRDPALEVSWLRFGAAWGNYRERTPNFADRTAERYGVQARSYAEMPVNGGVEFFWDLNYSAWFYNRDGRDQEIAEGFWGVRYRLGALELGSGYQRRYVWGESPMLWDSERDMEKIHQKLRFPIGRELFFQVRGSYDLRESMVDEVSYALQWVTDCMKWELVFRNDRTSGGGDRVSVGVYVLAFPETPASFGQYENVDPFTRPRGLPRP
jgi:LPS-assembly protein